MERLILRGLLYVSLAGCFWGTFQSGDTRAAILGAIVSLGFLACSASRTPVKLPSFGSSGGDPAIAPPKHLTLTGRD